MATVTDPICGIQVDPSLVDAQMVYEGHAYSVCSTECLQKFRENPKQYVGSKP
jgi:Cu+-exporting ATPase